MIGRLAVALLYLLVLGLVPARALVRSWLVAVPLSSATAGLLAAGAAMASLGTRTALWPWVVGAALAGWTFGGMAIARQSSGARGRHRQPENRLAVRTAAAVPLAVLMLPLLAGIRAAPTEWDARAIWFFHARWFWSGGEQAAAAMGNAALAYAHADYPPLVPATTAGLWSLWHGGDLRLAQAVTGMQTWLAVLLVGVVALGLVRGRTQLRLSLATALFAVAFYGVAGGFGTRGYADLAWAAFAVAGALAAFIHVPRRDTARVAMICFAAAMLTKGEGLVAVGALFLAPAALRWILVAGRRAIPWVAGLVVAAGLAMSWPLVARPVIDVTQRDITVDGLRALLEGRADKVDRIGPAVDGLWRYGRITFVSALVLVVAGLVLATPPVRAARRERRWGGGLWLPSLAVGSLALVALVLAAGELDVHWWVEAGGFRTLTVVRGLLLAEVLVLAALALDALAEQPFGLDERPDAAADQPPAAADDDADADADADPEANADVPVAAGSPPSTSAAQSSSARRSITRSGR